VRRVRIFQRAAASAQTEVLRSLKQLTICKRQQVSLEAATKHVEGDLASSQRIAVSRKLLLSPIHKRHSTGVAGNGDGACAWRARLV